MNTMNRYFNSKARVVFFLSAISYVWMQSASADCTPLNGWQNKIFNITIPKVVIPRNTPIGATLFSQVVNFPSSQYIFTNCPGGKTELYALFRNGWAPDGSGIAPTNLPGIGIKITDFSNAQAATYYRADSSVASKTLYPFNESDKFSWSGSDGFSIQLVKTGPTSTGSLSTGIVAGLLLKNLYWMTAIQIVDGGNFSNAAGCTVISKSLAVPLGSFKRGEFSGVGSSTKASNVNIDVDCSAFTNISMTLNATADSSSAPGVIAIDPIAGVATAKGIGIQLLVFNKPVLVGSPFSVGRATVTGVNRVVLTARYYQTKSTVTAGQANATATFTLTYN